jgi:hypothetical protein
MKEIITAVPTEDEGTLYRRFRVTVPTIVTGRRGANGNEYRIQPENGEAKYTVHGADGWACAFIRLRGRRLRKNDEPGTQRITLEFASPDPFDTPKFVCDLAERFRPKTPAELFAEVLKEMDALAADGEHEPGPYINVVLSRTEQGATA